MAHRPDHFHAMRNLDIGEELTVEPEVGEKPEAALARLKRRASKYKKDGRSYRLKIDGDGIRVQRLGFGQSKKFADWYALPMGSRLLLKTSPTAYDIKRAQDIKNYLFNRDWDEAHAYLKRGEKPPFTPSLEIALDETGRLVVECYSNIAGDYLKRRPGADAPVRHLWEGEWE